MIDYRFSGVSPSNYSQTASNLDILNMNSHDERRIFPVDAQGNNASSVLNSSSSTIKIDSLCIKLGFLKEKGDAEKCSHFSIRGYVSGMRERGRSNFLPFAEALPPMEVPNFKYWLCQSCVHNCGNANTSHETPVVSVCDQSMIRSCATSFPQQDCGVAVLPFGEGTSGLKSIDNTKDDDDDDENVLPAFGVNKSQHCQEIPVDNAVPKEAVKVSDTNVASEANAGLLCGKESNDEYQQQDSVVIETITGVVGTPIKSSQQNDQSNGHTRRKARKVRLLKELLCGNNEIQQKEKEISNAELDPKPCNPLPTSSLIKRKVPHDQDQIPVDITTPVNACKKAKTFKGNAVAVAVAKTTIVDQHSKHPEATENTPNDNRTQKNSINFGKVSSDPVTAWRSIFSDMTKTDNHVTTTATGACKPSCDISKDRGSGPHSNFMAPPHPEKKINFSINMSRNPLKSKSFGEELYSRRANVDDCSRPKDPKAHPEKKSNFSINMSKDPLKSKSFGVEYKPRANVDDCSRPKDGKSETELGLNLSLNHDPQTPNHPLTKDNYRKDNLFFGDLRSRIHNWIPYDSKSKKGIVHDVSKGHATKPVLFQEQRPYTYGSCSGHQKLDFSDPHKRKNGVRGYSDVMGPYNHQRKGPMVMLGRSDETEVVELMAKNQYERNLCEARSSSNNTFIPNVSGLHNINIHKRMTSSSSSSSSHQDNLHPSTSEKSNTGPTTMRNQASGFINQQPPPDFNVFDGNWRLNNSRYSCIPIPKKKKKTPPLVSYQFLNMPNGYTKCSEKDNQKGIMDLDLNVVAPNVIEEQNSFQSLNPTSSKQHHLKNIRSLDSSYPNETIPAMQLLSLMDAGKSNHQVNTTDERKLPKPLSPCYTHSSSNMINGKTIPIPNVQFPKPRQQESYVFPVPCRVSEDRSEGVTLRERIEPIGKGRRENQQQKMLMDQKGKKDYKVEDSKVVIAFMVDRYYSHKAV
ncbi:unnamed protein product [Lactuca saligna]|uniref:Uncharacterized protein n=1 Tax=Lactuca saligna TaxID=75948 RepID=A0AA35YW37_LACSI|nr:unnamed protein product [Lactuca saligna]